MKTVTFCGLLAGVLLLANSAQTQASVNTDSTSADTATFNYTIETNQVAITSIAEDASGNVVIPATLGGFPVTTIGRSAFVNRTHIASIAFASGANVTNIEGAAFQGCTSLKQAELPAGLASIPAGLFLNCTSLAAVNIPESVAGIGGMAFANCRSLPSLILPAGLKALGESAFLNCRSLVSIDIPDGITVIPAQLCYECRALTSVGLPSNITAIGPSAFYNCLSLAKLALPATVATIGNDAFHGCASLPSLAVHSALNSIGSRTFYDCAILETLHFFSGVGSLGGAVFGNCPSLSHVYIAGTMPALGASNGADMFAGNTQVAVYYLAADSGWDNTFCGVTAEEWKPQASEPLITNGAFSFRIEWASGLQVRVQACGDLLDPAWINLGTNTLTGGSCVFSDADWHATNQRYYRITPLAN